MACNATIEIIHTPTGECLAKGPKGWGMLLFEGNYYIAKKHLITKGFRFAGVPGFCPYKFIYFWYHFKGQNGTKYPMLGWVYWLPNPLFFFIAFRIAVPANHPHLQVNKL